jgi:ParB/RepB/Spo0J family partition protein
LPGRLVTEGKTRLLEPHELAEQGPPEAVRLPIELVDENPRNPRRELAEIDALAENIRVFGLLQPVTVRRQGERYELLGGHRRRAAFALLREQEPHEVKWRTIPAVVRTADDESSYLMLISGQVHNRAWKPREEAAALERLAEVHTLRQIGDMVHRGESWVSKRLRIYADSVLSGYVQSGRLAAGVAEELLLVDDIEVKTTFAQRAADESWTQDQARAEARALKLDKQLRHIARQARGLLSVLSGIDPTRLPPSATRDLWSLRGRIEQLATGQQPVFPTIEAAQRAANINATRPVKRRRTRLRIE